MGPGWARVRAEAGLSRAADGSRENFPLALVGWVTGCSAIWSALFTVGNFLYGRLGYAWALLGIFIVSAVTLAYVINRIWSENSISCDAEPGPPNPIATPQPSERLL